MLGSSAEWRIVHVGGELRAWQDACFEAVECRLEANGILSFVSFNWIVRLNSATTLRRQNVVQGSKASVPSKGDGAERGYLSDVFDDILLEETLKDSCDGDRSTILVLSRYWLPIALECTCLHCKCHLPVNSSYFCCKAIYVMKSRQPHSTDLLIANKVPVREIIRHQVIDSAPRQAYANSSHMK